MPLLTKTFTIVAGLLSIPIFGTAIIAGSYQSPFTFHLADVVQGATTNVVAGTNAPNWSIGTPLYQVTPPTTATTTGTLASSTPFSVAVAALDGTGTTTLSSAVTRSTDPNVGATEGIIVSWPAIPGATGYAVFVATGTVTTASGFSQYFIATTSAQYDLSTTTGSLAGSYTKSDTTAFAFKLNPSGPSYIDGGNGNATSSAEASTTALQVNGNIAAISSATTSGCVAADAGQMFYNTSNAHEWGCNGSTWVKIY